MAPLPLFCVYECECAVVPKRLMALLFYDRWFNVHLQYLQFISYLRWPSKITKLWENYYNS